MKTVFRPLLVVLLVVVLYFVAWPVPIEPLKWDAPKAPEFAGVYAVNEKLAEFEALPLDGLSGPEAITQANNGDIYATTHEGWILRWQGDSIVPERWIEVGGRPLGIAFDKAQNLWVANAYIGLQKINTKGELSVAATVAENIAIRYADDLVVTPNGKVYFSDASTKYAAADSADTLSASLLDLMEHGLYGRIIEFDPESKETTVIMRDLSFANGVTAAVDGEYLLVAETGAYRIWKHWLTGPQRGQSEVLIDNLPGFPDNVHRGRDGRYWIGLTTKRAPIMDTLAGAPFLRKVAQRMPAFLRPNVEAYGHVIAIDGDGKVLFSLQDPQGKYPATTGAWETREHLYVSSLTAPVLARYTKSEIGVE